MNLRVPFVPIHFLVNVCSNLQSGMRLTASYRYTLEELPWIRHYQNQ